MSWLHVGSQPSAPWATPPERAAFSVPPLEPVQEETFPQPPPMVDQEVEHVALGIAFAVRILQTEYYAPGLPMPFQLNERARPLCDLGAPNGLISFVWTLLDHHLDVPTLGAHYEFMILLARRLRMMVKELVLAYTLLEKAAACLGDAF